MATAVVAPFTGRLDMALSNFAKGFRNNAFAADLLFPRLPVLRQRDVYYIYGRENQQLRNKTLRAPGSPAERYRFTLSTNSYSCVSRALASDIPDEDRAAYTLGDLNMDTARQLSDNLLLDRESRVATMATTPANYTNTVTLSGTSQWSDYVNSDPRSAIETAKAIIVKSGVAPNVLFLGDPVYRTLRNHPKITAQFQYKDGQPVSIGASQLAAYFDVDRVVVCSAIKDNGDGTQTFLWGKNAVLAYVNPSAAPAGVFSQALGVTTATPSSISVPIGEEGLIGPKDISFGKTFVWINAPGTISGYGTVIARNADPTAKSDILGVDMYFGEQITAQETGYLFANAVA